MKKYKNLILLLIIVTSFSCQEKEPIEPELIELENVRSVLSDEELQQVAILIGNFINEPEVKSEIISYATAITDNEVYRPFKVILPEGSAVARTNSVFATRLKQSLTDCNSCRTTNTNLDSLLIILEENYAIYAPYLAEEFSNSDEPITISWWDGIDSTGVTKGILSSSISSGRVNSIVSVDDEYASGHPTLLVIPRTIDDSEEYCAVGDPCDTGSNGGGSNGGGSGGGSTYTPRDIDCRVLDPETTLRINMPEIRLNGNTRGWPASNRIYIWGITGDFSINANGFVSTSPNIDEPWGNHDGKYVSRHNAKKGYWIGSGISFLKSNWTKSQTELRIIVANRKNGSGDFKYTGTSNIDTDGNFTSDNKTTYTITTTRKAVRKLNQSFDRCTVLGEIASDGGDGMRNGSQVYHFNGFSFYLQAVPR